MWAAAAVDRSCAVLEWLAHSVRDVSIPVFGVEMPGHEAVMAGWEALHLAVNTMGIQSVEGLSEWTGRGSHNHGGCPLQRASARTTLEQCSPHQRQGHFSRVSSRASGLSGM